MYHDITGVILSGGKSSRMGQNKSFLKVGEQTFIERTVVLMRSIFNKVMLITNEPEKYQFLGIDTFPDIYPHRGPLAGIHSGLLHSETKKIFIISCDMPLITAEVIRFIVEFPSSRPIVVPMSSGFIQNLCGIYSKECLSGIERLLAENTDEEIRHSKQHQRKCKVLSLLEEMDFEKIEIEKLFANYQSSFFLNINNPDEYETYIKRPEVIKKSTTVLAT